MSHKLVLQIANKQLAEATETLHEELATIVDAKLHEKKKMIAAGALNENKSVSSGFLTVSHKKGGVRIAYGGNMGHTEKHVAAAFDKLHGEGAFAKVKPHGEFHKDNAGNVHKHADYSYVLNVPTKKFNSELGIKDEAAHYAQMNDKSHDVMKAAIKGAADNQRAYEKKKGKVDESYPGPGKALRAALKMHFAGGAKSKLGAIGTVVAPAAAGALAGGIPGAVGAATFAAGLHANDIRKQYSALRGKGKGTLNYGPDYADKVLRRKKLDEGILNKVKKVVNKVGQAKRLEKMIKDKKASNEKAYAKASAAYDDAVKRDNLDDRISTSKEQVARSRRRLSLTIMSGRVGGFPSFKRKNPKGLAEGKNPAKLTPEQKVDQVDKHEREANDDMLSTGLRDFSAKMAALRAKSLKSIKEGRLSAKEATANAVKMVTDRTKTSEKARRERNNKNRGSDTEAVTPSGTETKAKTSYKRWLENRAKK